jgi:SHS2 domain-containing protein
MKRFRLLPHTADVRMCITADSLKDLFNVGITGMAEVIRPGFCQDPKGEELQCNLMIESIDKTTLLIDFLSEVLSLGHAKKALFCRVEWLSFGESKIVARIFGHRIDRIDEDIKAVTYHDADIFQKEDNSWECTIIFDI